VIYPKIKILHLFYNKRIHHFCVVMKKDTRKAYFALAWVSFFWGTTYLAAKISAQHMPGLFVAGVRQFVAGALLVGYFKSIGYRWPDRKSLATITVQGVLLLCISQGLLTWALEFIDSGLAAIIAGLVPLFVALFSILLLRFARFTPVMIVGLAIGFGGIVTIFYEHFAQLLNSRYAFGIGLSLIATLSWSFGTVFSSRYRPNTEILFSVGLQMLIAGCIMLLVCGISGKYVNLMEANRDALWGLLYLILVGSLLTYSAYVFAVSKLPPTQVSVYAYVNPIVAIFLGWLMLHEQMSINVITGTLITLGGVYLVNKEFKKQKSAPLPAKGGLAEAQRPA
jgi:drug/metabolite transporter (DMT)-like permease